LNSTFARSDPPVYAFASNPAPSAALAVALACSAFSQAVAADPVPLTIAAITQESWIEIARATGNGWMQFPRAFSFDAPAASDGTIARRLLVNWQTNADVVQFPGTHGWMGSADGGASWEAPSATTNPEIDMMSLVRRRDGTLVALPFFPNPNLATSTRTFAFSYFTSIDGGLTWDNHAAGAADGGVVTSTAAINGFRFHRGIFEDSDGSLFAAAYVGFTGTPGHHAALLKSTDGGRTWAHHAVIFSAAGRGVTETAVAPCRDGSWLAVMRSAIGVVYQPLHAARSLDRGLSWSAAAPLSGLPANSGVDPTLLLLPNGVLVLSYGDHRGAAGRDVYLAFSADGNGASWSNVTKTFGGTAGVSESTGYTALVPLGAHRFLQIADTGGNSYYGNPHPTPNPFSIRAKTIDVALGPPGRLANLSLRADLTTDRPLIAGFGVAAGGKKLLVRAIGPGLQPFLPAGIASAGDPRLQIYDSAAALLESNDNWNATPALLGATADVGAFPLVPGGTDAATLHPIAGTATAHMVAATPGVGLIEVYDADAASSTRLVNVSGRYRVTAGAGTLIAGFVIAGGQATTVLIRGVGPTLAAEPFRLTDTLVDPKLEIFDESGRKIMENDTWPSALAAVFARTGAFPLVPGSLDAALVITLTPGAYTAHLNGADGGAGDGLLEIYEVASPAN